MNPFDENPIHQIATRPTDWALGEIVLNLTVSFLLGLLVAWIYRSTHRQLSVSFSFMNTLVIVTMVMSLVIMVIGGNLARAFGLVGAMSIIRFRTVVKDTRDTAFVFYALGAGMAVGTGAIKLALTGVLLIALYIGCLHWFRHGATARNAFLLSFDISPEEAEEGRRAFMAVIERFAAQHQLINVRSVRNGQFLNMSYQVELRDAKQVEEFVRELSSLEGIHRASLVYGEEAEN